MVISKMVHAHPQLIKPIEKLVTTSGYRKDTLNTRKKAQNRGVKGPYVAGFLPQVKS